VWVPNRISVLLNPSRLSAGLHDSTRIHKKRPFLTQEGKRMNSEILKGKWNQIKGDVKKSFGKLTDDDMLKIDGDATKAAGLLQERYGYTREEAEKKWNEFAGRFSDAAKNAKDDVQKAADNIKSKM
jgi:uncharacterized protein YjbJ (UPF0337 family)